MQAREAGADERRGAPARRIWPAVLSVLLPGAGHFAVGAYRRGLAIAVAMDVLAWMAVGACALGAPWVAAGLVLVAWLARAPICIDTRRRDGSRPRPRPWLLVCLAAGLVFGVNVTSSLRKRLLAEAYAIPGRSMSPTLLDGDHIMISKLEIAARRGDLVVYETPGQAGTLYVKRVVGVEGDTVTVDADGLFVNGAPARVGTSSTACESSAGECVLLREQLGGVEYVVQQTSPAYDLGEWLVPAGHVFVLGDNRSESLDSRRVGPITLEAIAGNPTFVWWSSSADGIRWSRVFAGLR